MFKGMAWWGWKGNWSRPRSKVRYCGTLVGTLSTADIGDLGFPGGVYGRKDLARGYINGAHSRDDCDFLTDGNA